ncbi:hypothetical protein Taro_048277 [Colocasia esculenta]|uniref:Uncharacterized protein n=1 Tax=Colocasia esculenta TaxID=4460 RepID=A0A843WXQ6_COLES|nr:hypothetical protein [Colocasia esculenta]
MRLIDRHRKGGEYRLPLMDGPQWLPEMLVADNVPLGPTRGLTYCVVEFLTTRRTYRLVYTPTAKERTPVGVIGFQGQAPASPSPTAAIGAAASQR